MESLKYALKKLRVIEFARLVASMNNVELFNDIYDSYSITYRSINPIINNCLRYALNHFFMP